MADSNIGYGNLYHTIDKTTDSSLSSLSELLLFSFKLLFSFPFSSLFLFFSEDLSFLFFPSNFFFFSSNSITLLLSLPILSLFNNLNGPLLLLIPYNFALNYSDPEHHPRMGSTFLIFLLLIE